MTHFIATTVVAPQAAHVRMVCLSRANTAGQTKKRGASPQTPRFCHQALLLGFRDLSIRNHCCGMRDSSILANDGKAAGAGAGRARKEG
jgi:hypothetical protein